MRTLLSIVVVLSVSILARAAEPFEIKEGDRVLFLGDTLLEREGTYGYLETRIHEQFPDRHFTVRNLSWSGETPRGWSRASFDSPDKGTERLKEDITKVRPTVVFLGFGMAASLQEMTDRSGDITLNPDPKRYGAEPMTAARFKKDVNDLIDTIIAIAANNPDAPVANAGNDRASLSGTAVRGTPTQAELSTAVTANEAAAASTKPNPRTEDGSRPAAKVRFVLLSPIRHEDLRAFKPGLPDPAPHNQLLEQYTKALEELAKERGARFVDIFHAWEKMPRKQLTAADTSALAGAVADLTPNGIHLSELGYSAFAEDTGALLGWTRQLPAGRAAFDQWKEKHKTFSRAVLPAVVKKNELFFHQFRPANSTYLFGFRKHEQGQNAKEMPMFDPLIVAAEAEIDRLKRNPPTTGQNEPNRGNPAAFTEKTEAGRSVSAASTTVPEAGRSVPAASTTVAGTAGSLRPGSNLAAAGTQPGRTDAIAAASTPTSPLPDFTVAEGYQIELWAQNPLLEKPTQMNWDPQGRLWVCSSSLYPQIEPGQAANDKILVLSDTDGDGKADKSEVFADGLLIPTGVVPDLVADGEKDRKSDGEKASASPSLVPSVSPSPRLRPSACYVGQSTELLHFTDTDGDGKADHKRIVFSGFGTEDTHHIIHTLHWGPDGRLYFHQSVYIHTHMETPWGMVRLNSGGVFAYDPRTERVEVFAKGLWNTWGQAEDDWGQTFLTDGAGRDGISWAFPGAVFAPFEGSRRQMPSVSPGAYPKFCGLEIVKSPHFPADWQGNMVTCDFRAHRIVRFAISDLAEGGKERRREGEKKSASPSVSPSLPPSVSPSPKAGYVTTEQPDLIRTTDLSFRPIDVRLGPDGALYVADWSNPVINHGEVDFRDPRRDKHLGRIWRITKKDAPLVKWESLIGKTEDELGSLFMSNNRWHKEQGKRLKVSGREIYPPVEERALHHGGELEDRYIAERITHPNPRIRVEVMRAAARVPNVARASAVLDAAIKAPADDPHYDFAAWQSINDLAKPWTDALASGAYKTDGREAQLAFGLKSIDPALASAAFSKLFAAGKVPLDGPWIDLIGEVGGPVELQRLLDGLLAGYVGDCCETDETRAIDTRLALTGPAADKAIVALQTAARVRNAKPAEHSHLVTALFQSRGEIGLGAIRLAGMWKAPDAVSKIGELIDSRETKPPLRRAAVDGLRAAGGPAALGFLRVLTRAEETSDTRSAALVAAVQVKLDAGLVLAAEVLPTFTDEAVLLGTWRGLLGVKGAPEAFALKFGKQEVAKSLPPPVLAAAVRAAREAGKPGAKLLAALAPYTGATPSGDVSKDYVGLAAQTKQNGDAAKGELVYRRATSACVTCHAIGGAGGKVGPDMTSIGASAPLDYIIESTLDPAAKVKEGYNAVTLTLLDGEQVTGIQSRETANEVFLRDAAGAEKGVPKAQIKAKADIGSMMPPGLTATMKPREALDMYAFLSELGKPGPYDASKGSVARVWRMYPGAAAGGVVAATYDPAKNPGFAGYTLVDGRFVKDLLAEATMIAAGGSDTVLLATQFQSSGKTRLKLTGASTAWLDGQPLALTGEVAPELANGTHTLVVKIGVKELPEVLRAESPDARFLGN